MERVLVENLAGELGHRETVVLFWSAGAGIIFILSITLSPVLRVGA